MKAVLISIKPNWCKLIWSGMKTVEVRKTRPKLETPFRVYVYCTLAASKEFKLDDRNWDVSAKNRGDWAKKKEDASLASLPATILIELLRLQALFRGI